MVIIIVNVTLDLEHDDINAFFYTFPSHFEPPIHSMKFSTDIFSRELHYLIVGFAFALVNNVGGGRVIIHTSRNIHPCTNAHGKSNCHHLRANLAMYTTTNFAPEFIGLVGPIEQGEDVVTPQCILYRSDASPKADIVCLCRCNRNVILLRGNALRVHY